MIFPRACFDSSTRKASWNCARGNRESITVSSRPCASHAASCSRSALRGREPRRELFEVRSSGANDHQPFLCTGEAGEEIARHAPKTGHGADQHSPPRDPRSNLREGEVAKDIEDHLVVRTGVGERRRRVVPRLARAQTPAQLEVPFARGGVHLGAEELGDLNREGAHPTRRSVDQNARPRLDFADVAQRLERRQPHQRRTGPGLIRHAVGKSGRLDVPADDVLPQAPPAKRPLVEHPEHPLILLKVRRAALCDHPGEVEPAALWKARAADDAEAAFSKQRVLRVQRRARHPHQQLVRPGQGWLQVSELKPLDRTVGLVEDRPHRFTHRGTPAPASRGRRRSLPARRGWQPAARSLAAVSSPPRVLLRAARFARSAAWPEHPAAPARRCGGRS